MLSEMASRGPSTDTWVATTTCGRNERVRFRITHSQQHLLSKLVPPETGAYPEDFPHSSGSSDCTWGRILRRIWNWRRTFYVNLLVQDNLQFPFTWSQNGVKGNYYVVTNNLTPKCSSSGFGEHACASGIKKGTRISNGKRNKLVSNRLGYASIGHN